MGLFGRKKAKPKSEAEALMEALTGVKKREDRKKGVMERKMGGGWRRFVDRRILIGACLILVVIIADGVRRENEEFEATLAEMQGLVYTAETEMSPMVPATLNQKLVDGNTLRTGPGSSATLRFPDGSFIIVGPESLMSVKLLEYNRGGAWRMRAFYLKVGQIWAKVTPNFGEDSQLKVYTPSSVAAVRGTTFSVWQSQSGDRSKAACAEGALWASGFRGYPQQVWQGVSSEIERGKTAETPVNLSPAERAGFGQGVLWQPPPGASWLQKFEYGIMQFLNAPLTILGIGKCGWAFGAIDSTRRSAHMEALRRLRIHLEGAVTYPAYVNPATLEELGLPWKDRWQILQQCHGYAIERYIPLQGGRDFEVYARARDKARTLFKLTSYGVERATPEEERWIL